MSDKWTLRGKEFSNCNCAYGCPCQFSSPTTYGNCEAIGSLEIEEGHFNDTRLDGLYAVSLFYWPGEIADGTYVGEVVLGIAIPNYSIVASRVEITISDGVADIVMDSTLDAGLEYVGEYGGTDVLVCSAVARMIYTGAGAASATIEIPISMQSIEILSVEGECEDSPLSHFDETEIFIFSATYSDGAFTSQTFEGLYTITARLEP